MAQATKEEECKAGWSYYFSYTMYVLFSFFLLMMIHKVIPENAALQVNMHIFEEPQRDDHAISEVEVQTLQFYKVPSDSYEKVIDNYPNEVITPPASQDSTRAAVVTINNLDDFLAIFEYSDDVDNTIYKIDLSNNSIGNEALEEFTTSVRNLNTRITLAVVSLDLSWNDLEEESIIPFSQVVLEKFSGLTSIKLDGNPIGVQGLEAILCAVGKTPIASTIDISVRETSIGDDGASCLGGFLKDNQLPITSLDLTNSCIFEGAVALALDLHDNTTLHTLIMDDNMIGNPGAFALGEALMANTHLRKLQIRNCDISATGIAGLCDGIRIHPVLEFLDVSLNPWELVGELKLLELMWALPRAVAIKWREGGWDYGEEELDFVVNHFSAESVLKRISETDSDAFCPLITNTQLLHCDLLASAGPGWIASQLAQKKHDSQYLEFALRALEVLTELATIHTGNQEPWTSILGTFCPLFSVWLSSTRLSFPTGLLQIKLVPLFCALVQFGDSVINGTLLQCIHKCMVCAELIYHNSNIAGPIF